tara:strand:+ start:345 stop:728 length:384 start_codon:yes stop_codon:yes gene_type:complete
MNKFSKTSLARRSGVDGRLVEISDLAIKICPIDFGIPGDGGIRTPERQQELFNEGLSKCDGFKNKSFHQTGLALDVYAYVDGKASWETEHLAVVAAAMLQAASQLGYKLEWGGLWPWDKPHFQLTEG